MVEQAGALGDFGDAGRATAGSRAAEEGNGERLAGDPQTWCDARWRAGDPSFSVGAVGQLPRDAGDPCREHARGDRGSAHCRRAGHDRDQFRRPRGQSPRAWRGRRRGFGGVFIHPLVAIDSATEAVLGLLDAQIWTRDDEIEAPPRRQRAIEDKESMRWLRGVERAGELLADAASVVVVGDRESDIYSCFARRPVGGRTHCSCGARPCDRARTGWPVVAGSLFASAAAWPDLTCLQVKVAPRRVGDPGRLATVALRAGPVTLKRPCQGFAKTDAATVSMTWWRRARSILRRTRNRCTGVC